MRRRCLTTSIKATFKAIEERYPAHQRDCTSDKKFLNMVMNEVCHIDIWKYDMKSKHWGASMRTSLGRWRTCSHLPGATLGHLMSSRMLRYSHFCLR